MRGADCHKQGLLTEYEAAAWYTQNGYTVCWPMFSQSPYDFIVEKDGCLKRVQVKTPTWSRSGTFSYLQCRLGKDLRVKTLENKDASGCRYKDSCDELIFIEKDTGEIWVFPVEVLEHTSNVCLKTSNPNPSVKKKSYNPDLYKTH